jgi:hypothetical protein
MPYLMVGCTPALCFVYLTHDHHPDMLRRKGFHRKVHGTANALTAFVAVAALCTEGVSAE